MNQAWTPATDVSNTHTVEEHLCGLVEVFLDHGLDAARGREANIIRLLAASPASPVVVALTAYMPELVERRCDFRFVFADRGLPAARSDLSSALNGAEDGLADREGVLRRIVGAPARRVHESLVLGDHLAWIGAPMPNKWALGAELGQIIRRPSAVQLAAMAFESVWIGSENWLMSADIPALPTVLKPVYQTMERTSNAA